MLYELSSSNASVFKDNTYTTEAGKEDDLLMGSEEYSEKNFTDDQFENLKKFDTFKTNISKQSKFFKDD